MFIYDQKKNDKECNFYMYQILLKNRLDSELYICTEKGAINTFYDQLTDIYENM